MRVLHVTSELYPLVKTGGLADVAFALPRAQREKGIDARIIVPGYPKVLQGIKNLEVLCELGSVMGAARVRILLGNLQEGDIPVYVIDAPGYYLRHGNPYVQDNGQEWPDNHRRYALLSWVAAHFAAGEIDYSFIPEVVHAHDWHAALTPAYMHEIAGIRARSILTIHNIAFRGLFPYSYFDDLGFSHHTGVRAQSEFWGQISFLKAGIVYADRVTTVSPTYAREVLRENMSFGIHGVLNAKGNAFEGILNGLDYATWNPETDKEIAANYSISDLSGKALCRAALRKECGLPQTDRPLLGVVSRLADQKGLDLVLEAAQTIYDAGAQLVVLGSGDKRLEEGFDGLARYHSDNFAVYIGYNEALSHRIIAGCDVLLVPSRFEPCGLTQIMALKYGTLPIVHRTGGLADTITAVWEDHGDGFVFDSPTSGALSQSIWDAVGLFKDQTAWQAAMKRAMQKNFSWDESASRYEEIYRQMM